MRATARTLIAIALLALPPAAGADGPAPLEPGSAIPELGPRNYEKNAASGEYWPRTAAERALALRGEVLNQAAVPGANAGRGSRAAGAPQPAAQAGFAWGDAAVGAGVTLALIGLLGSYAVVRRRIGPAGIASPAP